MEFLVLPILLMEGTLHLEAARGTSTSGIRKQANTSTISSWVRTGLARSIFLGMVGDWLVALAWKFGYGSCRIMGTV